MKINSSINEITKTNLYIVNNGLGKVSLFSNFINELCEKDDNQISISSPYPELFKYHPGVRSSINVNSPVSELYKKYFNDIIYREPYLSNYIKGDEHILVSWRNLLGLKTEGFEDYVEIYTDDIAKTFYQGVTEAIKMPYIIFQLKGGTHPFGDIVREDNMTLRNYNDEYELIKYIHDNIKTHFMMIIKTHNDVYDKRLDSLERICTVEDEHILTLQEVVSNCDTFVSIDSCVQHLACNKDNMKKGIVLWSTMTNCEQIGHNLHHNIITNSISDLRVDKKTILNLLCNILNLS